ncbi:MAG: 2-C-methyl-D-erythritol 4-phosphate cytidylyltransferase [Ghiorsea sp.]|nr:2-C-methyl-D-erythritol 4-phosphate cytidylyltransferase [Ghiorsea sp.]MDQ7057697.1 2-C-methyl-D-erythritol 4-phosphate cytidylyltransferase [Ghiorsea sp.]
MKVGVLLLSAGSGKRFGSSIPKQYLEVASKPLILHTLNSLNQEPRIAVVQPVIGSRDLWYHDAVAGQAWNFDLLPPVEGGAERSISMQKGLAALPADIDMVAVHDAARALPSKALLKDVLDVAEVHGAAVPGLAVHDTIKRINTDGKVLETPDRSSLMAVQTPQVARRDWFVSALAQEKERLHLHTDDASVLEAAGFDVYISQGDVNNRKVTTPQDMLWLQDYIKGVDS